MKGTVSLQKIYGHFGDEIRFLKIYIREAHATDGWSLGKGITGLGVKLYAAKAAQDVQDPANIEERRAVAGDCACSLGLGIRTYVDELDDHVSEAYAAWPTRLYLVDAQGLVVYAGGPGPMGFSTRKFGRAIERHLRAPG